LSHLLLSLEGYLCLIRAAHCFRAWGLSFRRAFLVKIFPEALLETDPARLRTASSRDPVSLSFWWKGGKVERFYIQT
jgi:hypothetical protein